MITYAEALAEITSWTEAATFPTLDAGELADLVEKSRRADKNKEAPDDYREWEAATAYAVGDIVVPTDRDPTQFFTVTVAGTSGATEPDWSLAPATEDTITDGTVTWENSGSAPWIPTYNLAYGIQLGWKKKMGKCVGAIDFKTMDQSMSRSQLFNHCKQMAAEWGKRVSDGNQIELKGSLRNRNLNQVETSSTPTEIFDDFMPGGYFGRTDEIQWSDY